jgi:hypothetical protein
MVMLRNTAAWLGLVTLAAYFVGYYVFGHDQAKIVMDSLVIGSAVTIFITWAHGAIVSLRSGVRDGAGNILLAVWIVWTVILLYFVYVQFYTYLGRPDWLRLSPVGGLLSAMFFLAGAHAVLTPVNTTITLHRASLRWWLAGVFFGALTSGILMTLAFLRIFSLDGQ